MKSTFFASIVFASSAAFATTEMPCGPFDQKASVSSPEAAIVAAKQAWKSIYSKASWHAVFGPANVDSFEPYSASLKDGIWFVAGTPNNGRRSPVAYICASDGAASIHGSQ